MLYGRATETAAIEALLASARAGEGRALALRGEPGIGKSALLDLAASLATAPDPAPERKDSTVARSFAGRGGGAPGGAPVEAMRVLRASGIESESDLAFATLHQLLHPVIDLLDALPGPQRDALSGALGLSAAAPASDRFLVSAGVLSLLAEAAAPSGLLCLVDDVQWFDRASADALLFAARRLRTECVAMLMAVRGDAVLKGVPELRIGGLDEPSAARLLDAAVTVAPEVRTQLTTLTGGNPLVLREIAASLSSDQLAGRAPLPDPLPGGDQLFGDQVARLSPGARRILLLASLEADLALVLRAAALEPGFAGPGAESVLHEVETAGLVTVSGGLIRFRHPLVRSAVHAAATSVQVRAAHATLAELVGDDRRALHLAAATVGKDEKAAAELAAAAGRAQARGGYGDAATALARAAELTPDPLLRAERLKDAATAAWLGGRPGQAQSHLAEARDLATPHGLAESHPTAGPPAAGPPAPAVGSHAPATRPTRTTRAKATAAADSAEATAPTTHPEATLTPGKVTGPARVMEPAERRTPKPGHGARTDAPEGGQAAEAATVHASGAAPTDAPASAPADTPRATPADGPGEVPGDGPGEVPGDGRRAVPSGGWTGLLEEIAQLRGRFELTTGDAAEAVRILAAGRSIEMLADASEAASYVGDVAAIVELGRRAAKHPPGFLRDVVAGIGAMLDDGTGRDLLRGALAGADELTGAAELLWASAAASYLGEADVSAELAERAGRAARVSGMVGQLPIVLEFVSTAERIKGRLAESAAIAEEGLELAREAGYTNSVAAHLANLAVVSALRGEEEQCRRQAEEALAIAIPHRIGLRAGVAAYALAMLDLGMGRYAAAHARFASVAAAGPGAGHPTVVWRSTPDRVEAAVAAGEQAAAEEAVAAYERWSAHATTDEPQALLARCHALVGGGAELFEEALRRHGEPFERARTALLYGERLRRAQHPGQARHHLRAALETFERLGARPWADRAHGELRAAGEAPARPESDALAALTPQELRIARLVAEGASSKEVAARLFLSPRTVEYHLYKIYPKLGITSRTELARLL
ncbi:LuxR family transcriptional regulator [Nonomuraea sp. SYSU D8015]|uniref:LuxR C-terminal-related transcriptional regulator n=1 Tax=Nonomuraea sp. SYSU D8015 TaxID=2593644 RepID=UPI001CB6F778|nr:LuxR family transcriptional regulator [Nonomuraea sp. SYSU D8015]